MAENTVTVLCLGHDVAITNVQPAKTVIGQGYDLLIGVAVKNYGTYGEAFDTTACSNQTVIQIQAANLASGESTLMTFTWNTTNAIRAYTITANATILPEENDISDNALVYGIVKVTCIGDINGDYVTDVKDYQLVKEAIPSIPGSLKWYPNADINCDGAITAKDYQLVKSHIPSYA
jgi:hypothetical protein